jgi:AraC-type DNA-binding domain-containing proteins
MFISYAITFIIPLMVMGVFGYFWMGGIIREQNKKVYDDNLQKAKSELDKKFFDLDKFCYTIAQTQWMQLLIYLPGPGIDDDRMDAVTLKNHLSELANYKSMNGFIENMAIYMYNTDLVLYPGGVDNFNWFFSHTYAFDKKKPDYWLEKVKKLDTENAAAFIVASPVYKYTSPDNLFVYMKTLPMRIGQPCATIFFMIEKKEVESILKDVKTNENASVFLFDEKNSPIAGVNTDPEKQQIVEKLLTKNNGKIPDTVRDNSGKNYFVYSLISEEGVNAWKYIALFPKDDILSMVQLIKYLTLLIPLLISVFLLLAGITISYGISLRNYRPVKKLAKLVLDGLNQPKDNNANEYDLIENGIRSAIKKQEEMKESMGKYQTIILKDLMEKLLDGQNREISGDYKRELAFKGFGRKFFAVVTMETEHEWKHLEDQISNPQWSLYVVRREKKMIVIINVDEPESITMAVDGIKRLCGDLETTIGIGNVYEVEYIFRSYNEARIALDYEMLKGKGSIIRYGDIDISTEKTYHYPVFLDQRFVEGIETKNCNLLRVYFDRTLRYYISQSNLSLSIERLLFYKRVLLELEKLPEIVFESIITGMQKEFLNANTIEEVQASIENIYKQIFHTAIKQKETYSNELIRSILKFIDENYSDSSLSLTKVADRFNMNLSKMSVFFKEQTGENFIDYLLKKRIHVSKELLLKEGLTVEEIGIQVGFDSVHTFRRVFKKYEVLTPGQYRDTGL